MVETILSIVSEQAQDAFSSRDFIHDYPSNSKIEARYQSNGRLYCSHYNVLSLGTYPSTPKLTQKSRNNTFKYHIPNNYIVKTEVFDWKIGRAEWSVSSTKSSTAVFNLFLQDLDYLDSILLYHIRLQIGSCPLITTIAEANKCKRPFEDITEK
ncbi:11413_t:CDS:2 [Funneliformis mosseae]|uniref:11413_t:CDS:1 n=1 Tax=Funneliformis mosseae TaxID=27381 RepID=A0A9N9ESZ2_FUNMO|nr:11413_t:CDS:2 [Funneliformis mosseae]